jgi:hypothetical protein
VTNLIKAGGAGYRMPRFAGHDKMRF